MKYPILLSFALVLIIGCKKDIPQESAACTPCLSQIINSLGINKSALSIHIDKSDYKLNVLINENKQIIKSFPVVFGADPVNDKVMEGDRRTPEGVFSIRDLYPHKSWSKFIWIDYPTEDSWKKHKKAKSENRIPQNATIGGEIGIHGTPDGAAHLIDQKKNWTWGCVSLKNHDVDDLYSIMFKGMKIEIVP